MRRVNAKRGFIGLAATVMAVATFGAGPASAAAAGPVTKTFSFIGPPNSKTSVVIVNIDSLLINARCNAQGAPVIFAFSEAPKADIFGHIFDGLGRMHLIHNTSFNKGTKGISLSTSSGDYDANGVIEFESSNGKVVTINYAFDNSTTLSGQRLCTVFGSLIAS